MNEQQEQDFSEIANHAVQQSVFGEFIDFLKTNKKWWLAPIVLVMLLMGLLIVLSGSAAAPFIYTMF